MIMNNSVFLALRAVFGKWQRAVAAVLLSVCLFCLLILIPVWTVPGNDFWFQLSIMDSELIALTATLSVINGILLVMQGYLQVAKWRLKRRVLGGKEIATTGSVALSVLSASIACTACYSSLIAVFGLGATTFIFTYRYAIAICALVLALVALWHTVRAVNGACETCSIG